MAHIGIKDLARILNISTSTVSRALRGSHDVNPDTRRKVLELAEQLQYMPNHQAIGLVKRRSMILGIVVPAIDNEFFSNAIHGIEEKAYQMGYHVLINQSHDRYDREVRIVEEMLQARVDGLIISLAQKTEDYQHLRRLQQLEVPLVLFDRICDVIHTHKVINDNFSGAYKATQHLIAQGYRKIAHIGGPDNLKLAHERINGYFSALRDSHLPVEESYVRRVPFYRDEGRLAATALLTMSDPPDAVFAASDNLAIGALIAARELGVAVPDAFAIIGFSDISVSAILSPSLSTIHQHAMEMGSISANLLLQTIADPALLSSPKTIILPTSLIKREST